MIGATTRELEAEFFGLWDHSDCADEFIDAALDAAAQRIADHGPEAAAIPSEVIDDDRLSPRFWESLIDEAREVDIDEAPEHAAEEIARLASLGVL